MNNSKFMFWSFLSMAFFAGSANATVFVNDFGTTGWRNESLLFNAPFSGTITIGVSDEGDTAVDSTMLLDNINLNGSLIPNGGFETDNIDELTNFSAVGDVSTATSDTTNGISARPTEGDFMAVLSSTGDANTSGFTNAFGESGTEGSLLRFFLNTDSEATLSFDWNFLTGDFDPFNDFGFLFAKFDSVGTADDRYVVLAQIEGEGTSPIPLPASAWLFGSAILGLFGVKRKSS